MIRISYIVKAIQWQIRWIKQFTQENIAEASGSAIERLRAFRYGFLLETMQICGITKNNKNEYLSDKQYSRLHPINREYSKIIDNKMYLPFLLKDFPELVPEYYFYINKGILFSVKENHQIDNQEFIEFCKERKKLVLKPSTSTMGSGFHLLEWKEDQFWMDNIQKPLDEFFSFLKSLDYTIVTEFIQQHDYSSQINPSSLNTIRLICIRDQENGEILMPVAFHRFGGKGKIVDNIGASGAGMLLFIDIETGITKELGLFKQNENIIKVTGPIKNPNSNEVISGITLPHWNMVVEKVRMMMNKLNFLAYVGLDIAITQNGFKIIEINSLPTLTAMQIEQGFFKNEQLKRFFTKNNISK